ncbi:hypothetical protein J3R83DRAFT_4395 [Lanmaoa asiatica]|nr:hypothetical protein J3R83DRAFT_4395 [Lanmaoa asiatica]
MAYAPCSIQTLFNGVGKAYFKVEESLKEATDQSLYEALSRLGESADAQVWSSVTDKGRTPPALLKVTGWLEHLPQVRDSRRLREAALALKDKHKDGELGGILSGLDKAVDRHFERGRTVLDGHGSRLTLLKTIIYGSNIPSEGAKHWRTVPADNQQYPAIIKQWMASIFRANIGQTEPHTFVFVLSEEQRSRFLDLQSALRTNENSGIEVDSCYQAFVWSIVTATVGRDWKDVTQRFMWLRALRPCGNFYSAASFTPDLAKIKYFIRQTTLLQAFIGGTQAEGEESDVE